MPDCNPNPRRYSEEESRMKGVAFSEDIVLLPIPEIPEDDNCPETDIPPEAQVRVNQRIVFSTVTQTIDRIIDRIVNRFADVVKEVTKTVTLTDTVINTVTSTVTQTITQPRVCSPCPACTPHTATASPTASANNERGIPIMFYYGSCYVIGSQPTDTTVTVYVRHADELTRLCASGIMSTDIYVDIIMSELFNGQFESFTHYCENGRVISGVIGNGNWQQGRICSGSGGVTVPT